MLPAHIKKVLLVVNPKAGTMKSRISMYDIIEVLSENDYLTTTCTTTKAGDAKMYAEKYSKDHDLIICCGGDGTLNETITGVMKSGCNIPIGYIPSGSTNDMAKTLQMPLKAKKAVTSIINGSIKPHDIGILNDKMYFGYIASFGAFTKVSYATPQALKNKFGHFAYILDGIKSVGEIKPYRVKITCGDTVYDDDFLFGSITNSLSVGGVLKFPKELVKFNDGLFEVLLIKNPKNPIDLRSIFYGISHQKYDNNHVIMLKTDNIEFEFKNSISWTCDGEFGEHDLKANLSCIKGAINIVVPNA